MLRDCPLACKILHRLRPTPLLINWEKLGPGKLKLNMDGSSRGNPGHARGDCSVTQLTIILVRIKIARSELELLAEFGDTELSIWKLDWETGIFVDHRLLSYDIDVSRDCNWHC
ncbi:hypothetical protein ACH5RR_006801 [Cinchona calisaya]|uniref:Reverse transcriptase n=1 Tax=Cinchona calisaya TaxID=153742 RepID=A0ABD3AQ24_9GENT